MNPRNFLNLFKIVKDAPEYDSLTHVLKNSQSFKKFVHKTEFMKMKFWQKIDEAAFPEEY